MMQWNSFVPLAIEPNRMAAAVTKATMAKERAIMGATSSRTWTGSSCLVVLSREEHRGERDISYVLLWGRTIDVFFSSGLGTVFCTWAAVAHIIVILLDSVLALLTVRASNNCLHVVRTAVRQWSVYPLNKVRSRIYSQSNTIGHLVSFNTGKQKGVPRHTKLLSFILLATT